MRFEIFALFFAAITLSTRMGTCQYFPKAIDCKKIDGSSYDFEDSFIVTKNFGKFCDNNKLCFDVMKNILLEKPQYATNYTCLDNFNLDRDFKGKCPKQAYFNKKIKPKKWVSQPLKCCIIEVISGIPKNEQQDFINAVHYGCHHRGR